MPEGAKRKGKRKAHRGKVVRTKNVKGFNDMPPRGKEGAIRKRISANAPPLAAHCPSFALSRSGAFLLFRLAFVRVLVGALSAPAPAALRSATCHNKHTYYCQFGFLRVFSVENHLNLSVVFSVKKKACLYSERSSAATAAASSDLSMIKTRLTAN